MNPQTQPIIFECQGSPSKQVLKNSLLVIVITLIIIWPYLDQIIKLFISDSSQLLSDLIKVVFPIVIGVIIVYLAFFYKKVNRRFIVNEQGINVGGKVYLYSNIKNFHMLGDSQDERSGLGGIKYIGGYDLVNPYYNLGIYVLKLKGIMQRTVRLQVLPDKMVEFENILSAHNLVKESKVKMYFTGINKWFVILFIIPFGLLVLYFLYGLLFVF